MEDISDHNETLSLEGSSVTRDPVIWNERMTEAKPFLMPSEDGQPYETLPPEKENRKIQWAGDVELCEIENRWQLGLVHDDDEDSYDIEIVDDDGDADFYLEIVDGEIFYVFETDDDMSLDDYDDDDDDDDNSSSAVSSDASSSSNSTSSYGYGSGDPAQPVQLDIPGMTAEHPTQFDIPSMIVSVPDTVDEAQERVQEGADVHIIEPEDMELEEKEVENTEDETPPESSQPPASTATPLSPEPKSQTTTATAKIISPPPVPATQSTLTPPLSPVVHSESPEPVSPVRSILKPSPPSPVATKTSKKKKQKNAEKAKTITKRYVRADTFDGEHQVFTWEKPKWTDAKLRETDKGEDVRKGGNLANPITFPKKKSNHEPETYEDDQGNIIDKEELVRRIQEGDDAAVAFIPRPTYGGRYQRKLRCSALGDKIRKGHDLAKPITRATVDRERQDINHLANKDVLKNRVKTVKKTYSWDKPAWLKTNLKQTEKGGAVKSGESVSAPITHIREAVISKKDIGWQKPEWVKTKLKGTAKGSAVKQGESLQKPITHIAEHIRGQKSKSDQ